MKRIEVGIKGFDELIEGGIPVGSSTLLSGTPGTGKTIFGLEYIYRGAEKFGEKGLYITFEEKKANLIKQAKTLGFEIEKFEKNGTLKVISIPVHSLENSTPDNILEMINDNNIQRVVIDSLSTLTMNTPTLTTDAHTINDLVVKRFVYKFINKIAQSKATIIFVSHCHSESKYSIDGVSEFICDGIIKINSQTLGGEFSRSLKIAKMRNTNHDEDIHPMEISKYGLVVHSLK